MWPPGRKAFQAEGVYYKGPVMGGSWGAEAWAHFLGWGEGPRGSWRKIILQRDNDTELGGLGKEWWFCPKTVRSYWGTLSRGDSGHPDPM